jgi:hypothetical protein
MRLEFSRFLSVERAQSIKRSQRMKLFAWTP